jgi:CheY-like chemotaxis protein
MRRPLRRLAVTSQRPGLMPSPMARTSVTASYAERCAGRPRSFIIRTMSQTVLVIDDRPDARYVLARMLEAGGYAVRETATGRDGLRLARLRPDLIVLDIDLPDIDGFEVVRQLKQDMRTRDIPVIHKTAFYVDAEYRQRALAAGADDYLAEPFSAATLVRTVQRLLRRAQDDPSATG